jgi:hypothetical protein
MAEERFGKGRAKAKAAVKKQLKDTIRHVPVKDAKRRPRANPVVNLGYPASVPGDPNPRRDVGHPRRVHDGQAP